MTEIIPAIIPKDFKDLREKMFLVLGMVPLVQIDVMDGNFTPEASWPYNTEEDPDFLSIKNEEKPFPFTNKIDFEVDLMVKNPESLWFDWVLAGAKRIIFHLESTNDIGSLIKDFRGRLVPKDSFFYVELGIAVDIATDNENLTPFVEDIDFVQFMGIKKIGLQGEPFSDEVLPKIKNFRESFPELTISVDGGVSLISAPKLIEAGANRLVSASAILRSESIRET